jgi:peptidoglycan/xylan/chitin deacetylase (PgdA/CDA1 family)
LQNFSSKFWYYTKNLKYLFQKTCTVLIYHRVTDLSLDPQLLTVSPSNFENQVKHLKDNYTILSLKELIDCLKKKKVPKRTVVITFDDGYRDNYYEARPILERYQVPATIFISSGMVGAGQEFWWDELEYIFYQTEDIIHKPLKLGIKGKDYTWLIKTPLDAHTVYNNLHPLIKGLTIVTREEVMEELFEWAGKKRTMRASHAVLSEEELKKLAGSNMIEIGAHTCFHPRLSNESREVQSREITESKNTIEKWLHKEVSSFSYPFGLDEDFNNDSLDIVKRSGYSCGIANIQACVTRNTDPFLVPRWLVRNWDVEEFEMNMKRFAAQPENMVDFLKAKFIK